MDNQTELDTINAGPVAEVRSSNSNRRWLDRNFMISLVSSILCFPPLGILTFIKSRQYRRAKLADDVEAVQTLSRDGRHLALISCLMGLTFIVMVTTVLLLQFLYFQTMADDMKSSWHEDYFVKTLNLTLDIHKT